MTDTAYISTSTATINITPGSAPGIDRYFGAYVCDISQRNGFVSFLLPSVGSQVEVGYRTSIKCLPNSNPQPSSSAKIFITDGTTVYAVLNPGICADCVTLENGTWTVDYKFPVSASAIPGESASSNLVMYDDLGAPRVSGIINTGKFSIKVSRNSITSTVQKLQFVPNSASVHSFTYSVGSNEVFLNIPGRYKVEGLVVLDLVGTTSDALVNIKADNVNITGTRNASNFGQSRTSVYVSAIVEVVSSPVAISLDISRTGSAGTISVNSARSWLVGEFINQNPTDTF